MRGVAILIALACSACGTSAYTCADAAQCVDGNLAGMCQLDGYCSFPDPDCASGQRYGDRSGPQAGACVPTGETDATSTGTTTSPSTSVTITASNETSTGTTALTTTTPIDDSSSDGGPTTNATAVDSTTGPATPLEPLLWFTFNDISEGIANEGSLGGVAQCSDGTCPSQTMGLLGAAALFDGIDDCAQFPFVEQLTLAQGLTIAAWIRRDAPFVGFDGVMTKPLGELPFNSWRLAVSNDERGIEYADFHVGLVDDSGGTLITPLVLGEWTHVIGTWDGATMRLWQDGVLVQSVENDLYEVDEQPVFLGCDDEHGVVGITHFFHGALDEVRLYDRGLDDDEVAFLFGAGD